MCWQPPTVGQTPNLSQRLDLAITTVRRWRNRFAKYRRDIGNHAAGRYALVNTVDGQASGLVAVDGLAGVGALRLAPHEQDSWKLSADPLFGEEVRDIVGLYLNRRCQAVCYTVVQPIVSNASVEGQP